MASPLGHDDDWDLSQRTAVVTGATNGLGKEVATELALLGATVVLACRNLELAHRVAEEIRAKHPGSRIEVGPRLDLSSQQSVRRFAAEYAAQGRPLHLLVNNAGANHHGEPWSTEEGIGGLCQVNYLGPYTLTRLLEGVLLESAPARVVNVSSVTHRYGGIRGALDTFLQRWQQGSYYPSTKLANVLFAYELQRRLGAHGVQSCAVDPGGVASNIWKNSAFSIPPLSWVIGNLYAPTRDGAQAVIHAASVPWGADRQAARSINAQWAARHRNSYSLSSGSSSRRSSTSASGGRRVLGADNRRHSSGSMRGGAGGKEAARAGQAGAGRSEQQQQQQQQQQHDLRFYARGLFAAPWVTSTRGVPDDNGPLGRAWGLVWGIGTIVHSLLDWPLRNLSGGRWNARTRCVPSAPLSYDEGLARELWERSAAAVGVPAETQRCPKCGNTAG